MNEGQDYKDPNPERTKGFFQGFALAAIIALLLIFANQ
jgi:hypothetical protein